MVILESTRKRRHCICHFVNLQQQINTIFFKWLDLSAWRHLCIEKRDVRCTFVFFPPMHGWRIIIAHIFLRNRVLSIVNVGACVCKTYRASRYIEFVRV